MFPLDRRRHLLALVVAAGLPLLAACAEGDADAAPSAADGADATATTSAGASAAATTLGTIEASVGGEARTWYVLAGEAEDGPWAGGMWREMSDGLHLVTLGGLDSEDAPIETFSRGGGDLSRLSVGDYEGSAMNIAFRVAVTAETPVRITLPDAEHGSAVVYMPVFDVQDMSGMLSMESGTLTVEEISLSDGELRTRGTFSGTLTPMQGGTPVEVTGGRFDVRGLPSLEAIQPTGGG